MTKTNTNKNRTDRRKMSTAAFLLTAIAFISTSALASVDSISVFAAGPSKSSSSINQTKILDDMIVQNLTKTNVPVTIPLTRGYVNGFEVFYISTEASYKGLANHLTNFIHSRVSFAPALKNVPPQSLANIYVFRNGIKGSGPLGFQPNVADSQPSDPGYSPLWRINNVEWKQGVSPKELKSETDKTLSDLMTYGGAQVLNTDIKKMQVTFVGHRGFAPGKATFPHTHRPWSGWC